jgi:ABC-type branched-subunit amino acid transport system ATPase component/ABC-type branched-subunit amino acid transport system permease subunit
MAFGCLYAGLGMSVVVVYHGTGVINFSTGALAGWAAYVYVTLRQTGDLVIPVIGIPHRYSLGDQFSFWPAFLAGVLSCVVLGVLSHFLVFRPLRSGPVLAKVVASVGILLFVQSLTALQFGAASPQGTAIFGRNVVDLAGVRLPMDRLWLAGIALLAAVLLASYFKWSRLGLATRAAAENEQAASLAGYSPQKLALSTWVISSIVAGTVGIAVSASAPLNTAIFALAVIPALAAALIGQLRSVMITALAGLLLGSFQAVVGFLASKPWFPSWGTIGLADAVPFVLIIVGLFLWGDRLPSRGALMSPRLPAVPRNAPRPSVIAATIAAAVALLLLTSGGYRFGVITSLIFAIIMLSIVVLTGYVGQISLAQATLAGTAGFALSEMTTRWGVPFPLTLLFSSGVAAAFGVLVAVPALRIRGAHLAVVTLAAAVAVERFIFRNYFFAPLIGSHDIDKPTLFGLDLGIREGRVIARWQFGIVVLVLLVGVVLAVMNIARSATGRRMLAVRSNERAAAAAGVDVSANKIVAFAISAFLAGLGGALIGYSRAQFSVESFTAFSGLIFLAFAYIGGITSVRGALFVGALFAPLGFGYTVLDRWLDLGKSYAVLAGIGLTVQAVLNQEGIMRVKKRGREPERDSALDQLDQAESAASSVAGPSAATLADLADRPVVLEATGLTVRYGGLVAVDDASIKIRAGRIVGLIGPNGAGKTTAIDAMTGFVESSGRLELDGADITGWSPHLRARAGLARTWQSIELFAGLSVAENLQVTRDPLTVGSVLGDLVRPGGPPREATQTLETLETLGLADLIDSDPEMLSYGQQKLIGVARALVSGPRVMLLDEPAAGLDTRESRVLGRRLRSIAAAGPAILLVDHDMGLVLDVCDEVYVLDFGRIIAHGTPVEIRANRLVIEAYLGSGGE